MAQELDVDESFLREGYWWLPEAPDDQIAGTIEYDPDTGAELRLLGTFGGPMHAIALAMGGAKYQTIHGVTADGKPISLLKALVKSSQFNAPGIPRVTYMGLWLIVGRHILSIDEPVFTASWSDFDGLDAWLNRQAFQRTFLDNPRQELLTITPPSDWVLGRVEAIDAEVVARTRVDTTEERQKRHVAILRNQIGLKPSCPQSLTWHTDQLHIVNRLVELCTGRHLPYRTIRLIGGDVELGPGVVIPETIDVLFARRRGRERMKSADDPIYTAAELLNGNPKIMSAWFTLNDKLRPALDLLFTVVASRYDLYTDVAFLLAAQAWEVFHRLSSTTALVPKAEFNAARKAVEEAIPPSISDVLRDKFKSMLTFANEPSLRQRLDATLADLQSAYGTAPFGFDDEALKQVVNSRNYYTHYTSKLRVKALVGAPLMELTRGIIPVLFALILPMLNLDPNQVRQHLSRRRDLGPLNLPRTGAR